MGYAPRHVVLRAAETARRLSWPARTGVAAVAVAGLAGGSFALAGGASATQTSGTTVSLQSSSDGAVAQWTGTNEATLRLTLGSQSNSTFAEMTVHGVTGQQAPAPADEPRFRTTNYNAGSPRWVIDLSNGKSLVGYPGLTLSGGTGPDANGMAWAVGNGAPYTDYQTAYDNAGAENPSVTVTDAYVVADGNQTPGTTDTLTNVNYDQVLSGSVDVPPPGAVCTGSSSSDPAANCAWQQLGQPSGYSLDVKGRVAKWGTPIIAWKGQSGDPAVDFTVAPGAISNTYLLKYTPYGNYTRALQYNATVAKSAYNSAGQPQYCVSGVADSAGQQVELRGCAGTTPNQWQDLASAKLVAGSHRVWEPSYTGNNPMALNDKGYGGDGSPIINWAPHASSWNEEFYPGANVPSAG